MSVITRVFDAKLMRNIPRCSTYYSTKPGEEEEKEGEFRVLNLRNLRTNIPRRKFVKPDVLPPRSEQMKVDQDWGSVWPGPRTFHPAVVPLPIRQGYPKRGEAPPDKFGNAELMKIPNFLHLTPPVIARQCEALKKFCTPWPKELKNDKICEKYFPLEVTSSMYCHSSVTIRDPMARIITVKFSLSALKLDAHAKDKFLRLVGDRYDEETDKVTIVTDRCPMQKQNYDYAMYLITALYHESNNVETWEKLKSEADMEYYDWQKNASKKSLETLFGKPYDEIQHGKEYAGAVDKYMNEGESEYTINNYGEAVRSLLGLPQRTAENATVQAEDVTNKVK